MIDRAIKLPPRENYPVDPWRFVQKKVTKLIGRDEAIFTTSNGYFGIRGSYEEGEPEVQRGTFISGVYETWPIQYGEEAYGFAKTGQTMLPVADATTIKLFVDDEPFSLRHAYVRDFERVLDFRSGILSRDLIWDTAAGKMVRITSDRLVSFPERHMAVMKYSITLLNSDAHLALSSEILCQQVNSHGEQHDPRLAREFHHEVFIPQIDREHQQRITLGHSTCNSKLKMVCGIDHQLDSDGIFAVETKSNKFEGKVIYTGNGKESQPVTLIKYITYHNSSPVPSMEDLADRADRTLDRAVYYGFDKIARLQKEYLQEFWKKSDVKVVGKDPQVNQNVRLHIFHLLSSSARVQNSGIGAKGLTGSGYEGHAFWDIEVYMLPFLIYNNPRVAQNLLIYRYNMLDKARARAKELNHKGALFPWRTINGEEASAFFAAGTAQYHINADISFMIKKYSEVTDDMEFLCDYGAEILLETARLWADLGFYGTDRKFHIHGVTGPDEYNAIVNDNAFTNLMARENLNYAAKVVKQLKAQYPNKYKMLAHLTGLESSEIGQWRRAAKQMYIPFEKKLGINPQDDTFLQKEIWDIKNTPKDKFPLLLHHHPLELYRFQVIKQADVVLATFLLGNQFSRELKKRNFDYYDPLTTGDSSLSVSIQGIMASELGYIDLATKYYTYALLMDLADIGGNVDHGLHLASMGGIWMSVTYGIGGMRDYNGDLSFDPKLPLNTRRVKFQISIRDNLLEVDIGKAKTTYALKQGSALAFKHKNRTVKLKKGESAIRT